MSSPALAALRRPRARDRAWVALALLVSGLLHTSLAATVSALPDRKPRTPNWLEMALIVEPDPVPVPVPEPEPDATPTPIERTPPPVADLPPPPPVVRPIQGLSNESFLPGSGSGFEVRAGHTTAVAATPDLRSLDDPAEQVLVPLAAVTHPPKIRYKPTIDVPEAVKKAGLRGRVELLLTIDLDGLVTHIEIVSSLSPEADAACVDAMRRSRWKPGDREGVAVPTVQVPSSCFFDPSG